MASEKQVIIIRKDLNMRKGKIAAQAAHASMKIFFDLMKNASNTNYIPWPDQVGKTKFELFMTDEMVNWMKGLYTKVCVSVDSEHELLDIYNQAKNANLPCSLIQDVGLTEFGGVPTYTAVAIGPDDSEKINKITGHLKLL